MSRDSGTERLEEYKTGNVTKAQRIPTEMCSEGIIKESELRRSSSTLVYLLIASGAAVVGTPDRLQSYLRFFSS